jgi:uncharacterized membrane protein YtjA (UPF0391 family)
LHCRTLTQIPGIRLPLPLITTVGSRSLLGGTSFAEHGCTTLKRRIDASLLHYAVVFFVIALIAALFGFTGIAAGAAGIAKILFLVFILIAAISFIGSLMNKRR